MAMDIGNATLGYDSEGVRNYVREIKTDLVDHACDELRGGVEGLREAVDQIWKGKAANHFKNNMAHDVYLIVDALQKSKEVVKNLIDKKIKEGLTMIDGEGYKWTSTKGDQTAYNWDNGHPFGVGSDWEK